MLSTEISCWISWMSSSLDSRSICDGAHRSAWKILKVYTTLELGYPSATSSTYVLDRDCLSRRLLNGLVHDAKAATCKSPSQKLRHAPRLQMGISMGDSSRPSSSST